MANAVSGVEPLLTSEKIYKYLLYTGVALLFVLAAALIGTLGLYLAQRSGKAVGFYNQSASVACENLPEQFEAINLPARPGCWRVKLRPNQFSGKLCFPKNTKVAAYLEWENKDSLFRIRNKSGEVFTIDPRIKSDLGIAESNEVLQFKGDGCVRVKILRIWSPGDF